MRIDLTLPAGHDLIHVYVNGKLACEVSAGIADDRDTLLEVVERARAAQTTLKHILPNLIEEAESCGNIPQDKMSREKKEDAWARGLRDGLANNQDKHPLAPIPMPKEGSLPYHWGYQIGEALRKVAGIMDV